jgi:hypothetical protein
MKQFFVLWLLTLSVVSFGMGKSGDKREIPDDFIRIPVTYPGEEVTLDISLINGGIEVIGSDVKELSVNVPMDSFQKSQEKQRGRLKKIGGSSGGYSIDENNNYVAISVQPWVEVSKITVYAPHNTKLKLKCINNGNITVRNITSEIEADNINGSILLENVENSITAHALNQFLIVKSKNIKENMQMDLSTLNGDIELYLENDINANIEIKTQNGDVDSAFDIRMMEKTQKKNKGLKYRLSSRGKLKGIINDGGAILRLKSLNGSINLNKY